MENFVDTIMALAIGTAAFPLELMILGVIGLGLSRTMDRLCHGSGQPP
jgi:hypothetical protein